MDKNQSTAAPKPVNAAKFVFLYLVHLISLVFVAVSFGMIIYQAINKFIKDPVNLYSAMFQSDAIKFGVAAILVFTPIFFIVGKYINKALFEGEVARDSAIRRWLTYLILFVSFLIFAGYLVAFVISFLNGELTLKFGLKVVSVLAIASTIFSYYFYDIKRKETKGVKDKVTQIYFIATLSAIIVVFVGAFFTIDNPMQTRAKNLDSDIVNKFYSIDNCVDQYYREKKELPKSMEDIKANCIYLSDDSLKDKVTGKAFEYQQKDGLKYALCAEFRVSNMDDANNNQPYYNGPEGKTVLHDAGWQCLERKVYYDATVPAAGVK
jgi:hypothetical protein